MFPVKFDTPFNGYEFGEYDPISKVFHPATDFNEGKGNDDLGNDVVAAKHGFVHYIGRYKGWGSGYGNFVIIEHDDGNYSLSAHLNDISVKKGQETERGQLIGHVGKTGTKWAHLHFELFGDVIMQLHLKHWRKYQFYPVKKSKAWMKFRYIDPMIWCRDDIDRIPEWAQEDWEWFIKKGIAPKDPFKVVKTNEYDKILGFNTEKAERPLYEVVHGIKKFIDRVVAE